jgi:hemoglobin-like flavoprotein
MPLLLVVISSCLPIFRVVLLETFHHYLGPRFTPQMQVAWEEAFEMISEEMLKGADMLPLQEEGDFR